MGPRLVGHDARGPGKHCWVGLVLVLNLACGTERSAAVADPPPHSSDQTEDPLLQDPKLPSFCRLNPEACPDNFREARKAAVPVLDFQRCIEDVCIKKGAALAHFCRSLENPRHRALCWSAEFVSKVACANICRAIFK